MNLQDRLDAGSQQNPETGCKEWVRHRNANGYGMLWLNGKAERTHRAAWIAKHGTIPDGKHVLHKCDNPSCINHEHLFLGTNSDNVADKVAKNRQGRPYAKGSANSQAKLDEAKVKEVRSMVRSGLSNSQVARAFGVSIMAISAIRNHRTWTHVPMEAA